MSHTSSTLVPVPSIPSDPNFGNLRIKNDILYPKNEQPYTGQDLQVRYVLFAVTQLFPIISAALLTLSVKGWWRWRNNWTMSRFVVFWLISIQIFGGIVFFQKGATTRMLFVMAALHLQIEYMIIALLLKASCLKALAVAYVGGTLLYTMLMFVPDLSVILILTTAAGFTDFFLPLIFLYGKQYMYAVAGFAHLIQAAAVFCITMTNYGHTLFNFLIFFTTWIMNGALVTAIFRARDEAAAIRLPEGDSPLPENGDAKVSQTGEAVDNPLSGVDVPPKVVKLLFVGTIASSTVAAFFFVFVIARG